MASFTLDITVRLGLQFKQVYSRSKKAGKVPYNNPRLKLDNLTGWEKNNLKLLRATMNECNSLQLQNLGNMLVTRYCVLYLFSASQSISRLYFRTSIFFNNLALKYTSLFKVLNLKSYSGIQVLNSFSCLVLINSYYYCHHVEFKQKHAFFKRICVINFTFYPESKTRQSISQHETNHLKLDFSNEN